MNVNKLIEANAKLLDEKKVLENDVAVLEKRMKLAKRYCENNNLEKVIKILDGEEIE